MLPVNTRTHVDRIYDEFSEISDYLAVREPSMRLVADEAFRKNLLVASASYFEKQVKDIILEFVRDSTDGTDKLVEFVRANVTERGYHSLFDWNARNANRFWSSFGETFSIAMREKVRNEPQITESIHAFLELGRERNRLVHQDFGTFSLDKTSSEIYQSYRLALEFVEASPDILRDT